MIIKQAILADAETLTDITLKSKAHWGYSAEQIESWIEELTISKTYIETNHVFKLLIQDKTIAYYSYCMESDTTVTLDNLFVVPDYMRKGYGSYLLKDFLARIKAVDIQKVVLESEPNTVDFYKHFGFIKTGQRESSIKERYLPQMELHF